MKDLFYSSGKLLISAEYLVLNGAKALAVPTKFGQMMEVKTKTGSGNIYWTARNSDGTIWLNVSFILKDNHLTIAQLNSLEISQQVLKLKKILENALILNPEFLKNIYDYEIETKLEFPLNWGLGSSSTLIANISKWANINHFDLFFSSLSGSAYDVAVAIEQKPLIYNLLNNKPTIEFVDYAPKFADEIYFVYLNNKQKSDIQTLNYLKTKAWDDSIIKEINAITYQLLNCENIHKFEILIQNHEKIMSKLLQNDTIKYKLFSDYPGAIKSLGAWGGDFVLATRKQAIDYFPLKGYKTIYSWDDMIKK